MNQQNEKAAGGETSNRNSNAQHSSSLKGRLGVGLGVAAAAGGSLLAAIIIGVGPVAIAGAASYLVYREMTKGRSGADSDMDRTDRRQQ